MTTNTKSTEEISSLAEATIVIEQLRTSRLLFSSVSEGLTAKSEQHYLLALSCLEQAQRHMALAAIERELGGETTPKFWTGQLWWTGSSLVEITHIAKDGLMQAKLYFDLESTTRFGFLTPRVTCLPEETNGWTLVLKGLPTDDWDAAFAKYLVAKYPLNKETATTSTVVAPK